MQIPDKYKHFSNSDCLYFVLHLSVFSVIYWRIIFFSIMDNRQEFIEYVLYIAKNCKGLTLTKLYKLLWFANIAYADEFGGILVKDIFIKQKFWPVPQLGREYMESVRASKGSQDENIQLQFSNIDGYEYIYIHALREYNPDYFTEIDRVILDKTIQKHGSVPATSLSTMSHDTAWKEASMYAMINITRDMKKSQNKPIVEEQYDDITFLTQSLIYA